MPTLSSCLTNKLPDSKGRQSFCPPKRPCMCYVFQVEGKDDSDTEGSGGVDTFEDEEITQVNDFAKPLQ